MLAWGADSTQHVWQMIDSEITSQATNVDGLVESNPQMNQTLFAVDVSCISSPGLVLLGHSRSSSVSHTAKIVLLLVRLKES